MECVIDTNVLVERILFDSDMHLEAEKGLEQIDVGILPSVVVQELASVMSRLGFDKNAINKRLDEVISSYTIMAVGKDSILWAQKALMKEKGASFSRFNDKLILAIAKAGNLPLFTFDRDLIKECKENGVKLLHE